MPSAGDAARDAVSTGSTWLWQSVAPTSVPVRSALVLVGAHLPSLEPGGRLRAEP